MKIKDKLEDDTLDLSFCDLHEVPIREIATIKKTSRLDLSNNQLTSIPDTIVTLINIVKLDLSKNMLTEIPENIGEMRQLRYLDLYSNQISRLPLSLGDLKYLKWLDLKDNPLTPAVASVAGMCSNSNECQVCARNVVAYLSSVKQNIEEERIRRINAASASAHSNNVERKKETKKKKKKRNSDRELMSVNDPSCDLISERTCSTEQTDENGGGQMAAIKNNKEFGGECSTLLCKVVYSIFVSLMIIGMLIPFIFVMLPKFDPILSNDIVNYLEFQTKLPIAYYQRVSITKFDIFVDNALIAVDALKSLLMQNYQRFADNF